MPPFSGSCVSRSLSSAESCGLATSSGWTAERSHLLLAARVPQGAVTLSARRESRMSQLTNARVDSGSGRANLAERACSRQHRIPLGIAPVHLHLGASRSELYGTLGKCRCSFQSESSCKCSQQQLVSACFPAMIHFEVHRQRRQAGNDWSGEVWISHLFAQAGDNSVISTQIPRPDAIKIHLQLFDQAAPVFGGVPSHEGFAMTRVAS